MHPTKSPIDMVPYDVLLEIFIHCLPPDRLEIPQPNTRIAPMLLCHVCSYWRMVALAAPTLWSHLSYCLTASDIDDDRDLERFKFREEEIEFMRWWKKNQGSIAPFLHLDIEMAEDHADIAVLDFGTDFFQFVEIDDDGEGVPMARDGVAFVMDYVTTAQHLEVDAVFWEQVLAVSNYDGYPNLHTLMTHRGSHPTDHYFKFHHTFPALRRLALFSDRVSVMDTGIPPQWSTLTHLSITTFYISLAFWAPLTLSVSRLQWAYISFHSLSEKDEYSNPIKVKRTLPQLSALFIQYTGRNTQSISPLFAGLNLPALTDLFLATTIREWWNHDGMADIYTVLRSAAPALKTLTLQKPDFLTSNEVEYAIGAIADVKDITPIWSFAPGLAHLRLELDIAYYYHLDDVEPMLDNFARRNFLSSDNRWLDLDNPACPIQMITVIDRRSYPGDYYKTSSIRNCITKASNIALRIISKPFTDHGEVWKEWRLGN